MTPLVLVHGFMGGSDQWALQAPLGETRRVIAVDLPGFGRNAELDPINSISGFAAAVLAHPDVSGLGTFDLLGHSMGGMIVQEMMRQAPERVRRLILFGTGPEGNLPGRFEPVETTMARARQDGPEATARRIAATWLLDGATHPEYAACADIAAKSSLEAIICGLEAMKNWSGSDNLPNINAETLIIWGDRDRTYAWSQIETLWRRIPNSHLAVLPSCAHAVHLERPDLLNRIVDEFLLRN